MLAVSERWAYMLDQWMEKNKELGFTDRGDAIEYIVRRYIDEDKVPTYVKMLK